MTGTLVPSLVVLVVLVATGIASAFVPSASELALLGAGYLVYRDLGTAIPVSIAAIVGVLVGDVVVFRRGRGASPLPSQGGRRARAEAVFDRYGDAAIMIARIAIGARRDLFFQAGQSGRALRRVVLLDALAASLHVPLFVTAGAWFGAELERVHVTFQLPRLSAIAAALAVLGAVALYRRIRARAPKG